MLRFITQPRNLIRREGLHRPKQFTVTTKLSASKPIICQNTFHLEAFHLRSQGFRKIRMMEAVKEGNLSSYPKLTLLFVIWDFTKFYARLFSTDTADYRWSEIKGISKTLSKSEKSK